VEAEPLSEDESRECFIRAALRALRERGPSDLTVRHVAELAGASTMGIYTRFGGRKAMVEAVYRRGFENLRDALRAIPDNGGSPDETIVAVAVAYRSFALANASLYALMFERPMRNFDPTPETRHEVLNMTFGILIAHVERAQREGVIAGHDPQRTAYLLWTMMHGVTSIELTHAQRSPLPGWFIDSEEAGEAVLVQGIRAVLAGLRSPAARGDRSEPPQATSSQAIIHS
jgi:AcrR family transcriptional regulator